MPPWRSDDDNRYTYRIDPDEIRSNTTWEFTTPDTAETTFEINVEQAAESLRNNVTQLSSLSEGKLVAELRSQRGKLNDRDNIEMDANTLESWFVEQAIEQYGVEEVGLAFAEGGFPQVRQRVLAATSGEIRDESERRGDDVAAFNDVTMEWPHEARAYMAAYEHRFVDLDDETYDNKLQQFANSVGVLGYDTMQSELRCFHGPNPYADDSLSEQEAKVVMLLRANEDDESVISEVDNADNFYGWYKKTGDAEAALRACQFDSDIPEGLAPHLAPPEEWREVDPDNIEHDDCVHCGNTFYHVHHHTDGETWMTTAERTDGVRNVGPESEFHADSNPGNIICEQCVTEWEEAVRKVVAFDSGRTYKYASQRGLSRDWGENPDSAFSPVSDANEPLRTAIRDAPSDVPMGYFHLEPSQDAQASRDTQNRLLQDIVDNIGEYFDEGPAMVVESPRFDGRTHYLVLPQTQPMVAREGKELLDRANEYVETPI